MAGLTWILQKKQLNFIAAVAIFMTLICNIILSLNVHRQVRLNGKFQANYIIFKPANDTYQDGEEFASSNKPGALDRLSLPTSTKLKKTNDIPANYKAKLQRYPRTMHKESQKQRFEKICPKNEIRINEKPTEDSNKIACQPHEPSIEACQFADKLYPFDESLLDCKEDVSIEYCLLKNFKLKCSIPSECQEIIVHGIDKTKGVLEFQGKFGDSESLEQGLLEIINHLSADGYNFVFIECWAKSPKISLPQQVLTWKLKLKSNPGKLKRINLNIVLLDSISRAHFYRSLPSVVNEFEHQNLDQSATEVLDFSLFQSVHGHSAENAHALFTGELFPQSMTDKEVETAAVGIGKLFGHFKAGGYETMYQDDLCWEQVWGLRMELGIPKNWKAFAEEIKKAHIDNTGLLMSSCKILESYGLKNPFGESKNNQLCFNGRFQHDYILEYAALFHENSNSSTISYSALNTAHDWHGLRTQTLNKGLVKHIKTMSTNENTLTIFLADHGNTYTPFVRKILEGRYEMYHPSFFMLIPKGVQEILGQEIMNNLRANQNRLCTMLDINSGLNAIAELAINGVMPSKKGILSTIPPSRTCDDLNLKLPNLCVCDGWDNEAANDSMQISVLEYGVGVLNNLREDQRRKYYMQNQETNRIGNGAKGKTGSLIGRSKCHHLVPLQFKNVRERNNQDMLITTYDFVVRSGDGINQQEDIFHVEIESMIKPGIVTEYMKLLSFDRLSRYGPYRACADKGVDVRLCVCSLKNDNAGSEEITIESLWKYMPNYPGIPSKKLVYTKVNEKCINLIARYYYVHEDGKIYPKRLQSSSLEALNLCSDKSFQLTVTIKPYLMKVSSSKRFSVIVHGNSLTFLSVVATENVSWPANYTFIFEAKEL